MVICDAKEENNKDNITGNGKPKGKLTTRAKKWAAQFMRKYKAEREASIAKNQEQTTEKQDRKEKAEIQKEERKEADIEETDTQRRKQANKTLWKKECRQQLQSERNIENQQNRDANNKRRKTGGRRQTQNSTKCTRICR